MKQRLSIKYLNPVRLGKCMKIPAGCDAVDELCGGYETDVITTIYGPAGSGKTTMCMLAAIECVRNKGKVLYIDTEGGFSMQRLMQLAEDYKEILKGIMFLKPTSFDEQRTIFEKLKDIITDRFTLVVVDSVTMLYRVELAKMDPKLMNRDLLSQINDLGEIARKKEIPVLITNQVYDDFMQKDMVKMVGGNILTYASKCLIELDKLKGGRRMMLRKHRSMPEKEIGFVITEKGIEIKEPGEY